MSGTAATDDGDEIATALTAYLSGLSFLDRTADEVTELLVSAVLAWGRQRGWRVYRRAPSVLPLPPPYERQHSWVDVGCARPDGGPVVLEVDHGGRRRSVQKLLAEAEAGRTAVWIRWGDRPVEAPPAPVRLVTLYVTGRRAVTGERRYSRPPGSDRPPPPHGGPMPAAAEQVELFGGDPGRFDSTDRTVL
ncbi:hypothetical protein [Plantactinospora sp. KBS50]|uniref:hypothetical protein n=1 Tax=Plantactinospora sp. KBS50 TaxID=2024580 RepID=UPI0018DF450E|nr:hypothetical protein [Plantactinospora sp. KBS50]